MACTTIPWQDLSYLLDGNPRQRQAFDTLQRLQVLDILRDYTPVLVGTVPIAIDVDESDLDVVCEAHDLDAFGRDVQTAFGRQEGFRIKQKLKRGILSLVANFRAEFPVEIFGQPLPVMEQNAYRHMVVEARLLSIGGERARGEIQALKREGLRTEPAFARYFDLKGDPYETLLELSKLGEDALREWVRVERIMGYD